MKKTIIIAVVVVLVGVGIYLISSNSGSNTTPNISMPSGQLPPKQTPTAPTENTPISVTTPPVSAPLNMTVSISNFSFNPSVLTIKTGTKITWTNNDSVPHTVTSDSGNLLDSPTLSPGQSFSFTFTATGSVNYHCSIHKSMKGTITVEN